MSLKEREPFDLSGDFWKYTMFVLMVIISVFLWLFIFSILS